MPEERRTEVLENTVLYLTVVPVEKLQIKSTDGQSTVHGERADSHCVLADLGRDDRFEAAPCRLAVCECIFKGICDP